MSIQKYTVWLKCKNCGNKVSKRQQFELRLNLKKFVCMYCGMKGEDNFERLGRSDDEPINESLGSNKKLLLD